MKFLQARPGEQDNKTTYELPQEHRARVKIKTSHTKHKGGGWLHYIKYFAVLLLIPWVFCINLRLKLDSKPELRAAEEPWPEGTTGTPAGCASRSWWQDEAEALFSAQASSWLALYLYSFYGKKWMCLWGQQRLEEQRDGSKHRGRDWDLKKRILKTNNIS